ncbi:MAG: SDR family oxidoreductase [Proteobacteria bacterium]|nr:SDR family oxidoreductase [Pseudomonadota bacterium]
MTDSGSRTLKPGLKVLITAGAAGIGRAIADTFADHGARVWVCDISETALEACRAERPDYGVVHCDVAEADQIDAFFDQAIADLSGLDLLVNNAGIAGPTAGVEDIDPADWRRTVDVNLNSYFYCARRATPLLKAAGDGAMINISSVAGRLGFAQRTPYAATKWAVVGFTQSLAKELGPDGVRVNAILPGIVEGPRIDRVIAARAEVAGLSFEQAEQNMLGHVSLRRKVSAQDIANMALFLCSPSGRNISGQALSVCGNVETI